MPRLGPRDRGCCAVCSFASGCFHTAAAGAMVLHAGAVAPSVMLRKLAAYRRQNQLDLASQELGRIERTLFTLVRKLGVAPALSCPAEQERATTLPRAGNLHLQPRAGSPTAASQPSNSVRLGRIS